MTKTKCKEEDDVKEKSSKIKIKMMNNYDA